jgi:PAS domain S-box-containing protein
MDGLLAQLISDAPEAILVTDREGAISFWNSGATRMFGYSAVEATGQSLDLIIPESLRGRHWDGYNRVMGSGETKYKTGLLSSPGIRKDGSRISLEFSMVLLKDAAGAITGCGAIMRDVTEAFKSQKTLKAQLAACEAKLAG